MKHSAIPTASTLVIGHLLVTLGTLGAACAVMLAITTPASQFPWNVAGGRGTAGDPYRIETCQQLQNMQLAPEMHYALSQDVDCAESGTWNQGTGFFPIGYYQYGFSGTLDGRGYTIRNLRINRAASDYAGLFGKLDVGARVTNLTIEARIIGGDYAGFLAGWMLGGNVENVTVRGAVKGKRGVGGIAGVNQGSIRQSTVSARVDGREWVGGITGWNYTAAEVTDTTVAGSVHGGTDVGGVAGVSHGAAVRWSMVEADVTGTENVGGIVGRLVGNGPIVSTVEDCTFTGTVAGNMEGPQIGNRGGR